MLEANIGRTLGNLGIGKDFLNGIPFAQELRPTIDKVEYRRKRRKEGHITPALFYKASRNATFFY